jgi:UDP-N-acetyl-2-amino-2-deoxyglucuronate dehydrogenase
MGRGQAKLLKGIEDYDLVAVCDTLEANAVKASEETGAKVYTDYQQMLDKERPDVVAVCTPNLAHASQTIAAAKAKVKAVYCEKPMAVGMDEARAMVEACEKNGVVLVVNHQRRLGPDLVETRRLIESGAIGDVKLIRANNAGDILSDGTHAVDSVLWLAGDADVKWVFGQVHRHLDAGMKERAAEQSRKTGFGVEAGYRFGHPVENGGMGVVMLTNDLRVEFLCGDLRDGYRAYQDYEIFGTNGRIWRTGDGARPNLFIQDAKGGEWIAGVDEKWVYRPTQKAGAAGTWRPIELPKAQYQNLIEDGYRRMVRTIASGEPHPMNGRVALRGFEVVMAIYESARLRSKLTMPLNQDKFPLQLMVDAGQM